MLTLARNSLLCATISLALALEIKPRPLSPQYLYLSVHAISGTYLLIGVIILIWYIVSGKRHKTTEEKRD